MEPNIGILLAGVFTYWYLSRKTGLFLYALFQGKKYVGTEYISEPPRHTLLIPVLGEILIITAVCIHSISYMHSLHNRITSGFSIEDRAIQFRLAYIKAEAEESPEEGSLTLIAEEKDPVVSHEEALPAFMNHKEAFRTLKDSCDGKYNLFKF